MSEWGVPWRWRDQTGLDQQFPLQSKTQQASFTPSSWCWSHFTTSRRYSNLISPKLSWVTSDWGKYYLSSLGWSSDERWHERWVHHLVKREEGGRYDVATTTQANYCCWTLPSNGATTTTHLTDAAAVSCRPSFPYLCSTCFARRLSPPTHTRVVRLQTRPCGHTSFPAAAKPFMGIMTVICIWL